MANRPRGYGLTEEVNRKIKKKYNSDLEQQARIWIEDIIAEPLGEDRETPLGEVGIHEKLKDGIILCRVINELKPGSVSKISHVRFAFNMMENIANFLSAIEAYGVSKNDLFQTVDLYERVNMVQVINTIHALGRMARKNGYPGPGLGPKEADRNERNFTEEQLKAGNNIISLQMGSNKGASQAGIIFGKSRSIMD